MEKHSVLHKCDLCGKVLKSSISLTRHLTIHTSQCPFKCDQCGKDFHSKGILVKHMLIHTGEKTFECEVCGQKFRVKGTLKTHMNTHSKSFQCKACGMEMSSKDSLIQHCLDKHIYNCEVCEKPFKNEDSLKKHSKVHINKQPPYECSRCDRRFMLKRNLNIHMREQHNIGKETFECDVCGKSYCSKYYLATHKLSHCDTHKELPGDAKDVQHKSNENDVAGEGKNMDKSGSELEDAELLNVEPSGEIVAEQVTETSPQNDIKCHQCKQCDKRFKYNGRLLKHIMESHGNVLHKCDICGKKLRSERSFKRHLIIHADQYPYACDQCGRAFCRRYKLAEHMLLHTGEKPFACEVCGYKCRLKTSLKIHMNRHSSHRKSFQCKERGKEMIKEKALIHHYVHEHPNVRPFDCKVCGKSFSTMNRLKKHSHVHINKQPSFRCGICSEKFMIEKNFNIHMQKHVKCKETFQCDICGNYSTTESYLAIHKLSHSDILTESTGPSSETPDAYDSDNEQKMQMTDEGKGSIENLHTDIKSDGSIDTGCKPFPCETCDAQFNNKRSLGVHRKIHSDKWPYKCNFCDNRFRRTGYLNRHLKTVHKVVKPDDRSNTGKKPFLCNARKLTGHLKRVHEGEKSHINSYNVTSEKQCEDDISDNQNNENADVELSVQAPVQSTMEEGVIRHKCNICNRQYRKKKTLEKHLNLHVGVKFKCKSCGRKFTCYNRFKTHMDIHHDGKRNLGKHRQLQSTELPYKCTFCSKGFNNELFFRYHVMEHKTIKLFGCTYCNLSYFYGSRFARHVCLSHGSMEPHPIKCGICEKRCKDENGLIMHFKHQGFDNAYGCETCGEHLETDDALVKHLMKVHSDRYNNKPNNGIELTGEDSYQFIDRGKHSAINNILIKHLTKTHDNKCNAKPNDGIELMTDEDSYPCIDCGISFDTNESLLQHMEIHSCETLIYSSEPPYNCMFCDEEFMESENFKQHLRLHSLEETYKCEDCNKHFYNYDALIQHSIKHDGKQVYK